MLYWRGGGSQSPSPTIAENTSRGGRVLGGGRQLEGNFGTGVQESFLKPTPIIYLVFEKMLIIHLIEQKAYIFKYCSLTLYTLFAVCKQSLQFFL